MVCGRLSLQSLQLSHALLIRVCVSLNVYAYLLFINNIHPLLTKADGRHGIVRVDRVPLACKLVDLPCIIESLKTVDKKTFYKTADVCQVQFIALLHVCTKQPSSISYNCLS